MRIAGLIILTLAGAAVPAFAADRTGYQSIATGDLATAERHLVADLKFSPQRPELMLNLAAVYRKTGRDSQARALYSAVLDRPAVAMDMPSGTVVSSHDLATRGLIQLAPQQVATR